MSVEPLTADDLVFMDWCLEQEERLVCESCGTYAPEDNVTTGFCPYNQDVNGEDIEVTYCDDCYSNAAADI